MQSLIANPSALARTLTPDLFLAGGTLLVLVFAAWRPASERHQRAVGIACIAVAAITLALVAWMALQAEATGVGAIASDNFRWAADAIFLIGAIMTIAVAIDYQARERMTAPESHVLVLLSTSGMLLLGAARDLMLVFLGIEVMSVAVYVLVALDRRSARAAEGSLKYFLLGAFSTAFLLYGMALVYGATGHTDFDGIARALATNGGASGAMFKAGIALLTVGFGFKVAAAPFHMWAPDAYEGAPTPHTAFMAATVKAAAFASFLRLFVEAFAPAHVLWHPVIWYLAVVTMVIGNITALAQKNIKRLLAYSSIAHAGYILIAVIVGPGVGEHAGVVSGPAAFLFYLFAYTLSTMGVFAVVSALGEAGEPHTDLADYNGLWSVRPGLTLAMTVCLLALLGFPVFGGAGFWAKWYMIQAALEGGSSPQFILVVALVLTSVLSAGYYLGVVGAMFMRPRAEGAPEAQDAGAFTKVVIGVAVGATLLVGFMPTQLLRGVSRSTLRPAAGLQRPLVPVAPPAAVPIAYPQASSGAVAPPAPTTAAR